VARQAPPTSNRSPHGAGFPSTYRKGECERRHFTEEKGSLACPVRNPSRLPEEMKTYVVVLQRLLFDLPNSVVPSNDATSAAHLDRGLGAYVWQIVLSSVPPPPVHQDQYQDQYPYQDQDRCPPGCIRSGAETAAAQASVAYSAEAAAANKAAAAASPPPPPPPAGWSGFELRLRRRWRRRAGSSRSRESRVVGAAAAAAEGPPPPPPPSRRGGW
jgi:hypothetical protein